MQASKSSASTVALEVGNDADAKPPVPEMVSAACASDSGAAEAAFRELDRLQSLRPSGEQVSARTSERKLMSATTLRDLSIPDASPSVYAAQYRSLSQAGGGRGLEGE